MTADDPFAKMERMTVDSETELLENDSFLYKHTGLLAADVMPTLDHSGAVPQSKTILLHNPGSERCSLNIQIAGTVGDAGLRLYNRTTGQRCAIINLTAAETTEIDTHLEIDAEHGRVCLVRDGARTLAFPHHDDGYIQLAGAFPIDRDLVFQYEAGERKATCDKLRPDMVGKHAYLHGRWVQIEGLLDTNMVSVNFTFQHGGTEISNVVRMNEIVVTSGGINLPRFTFSYAPRYS